MKKLNHILVLSIILIAGAVRAQFDDLYYDPDTDDSYYYDEVYDNGDNSYFDDDEYDDYDEYAYWRDYDNYYASRIRRFHRPWVRIGFYNSWAYNSLFFDPWDPFGPYGGIGGSYFSAGFGTPLFNAGFANMGWNNSYWNPVWNNWGWNNNWYAGSWGWGGGWNPYCPTLYGGGFGYGPGYVNNVLVVNTYSQQSNPKGSYYGSRRAGSTSSSVKGVRTNPRAEVVSNERLSSAVRIQDNALRSDALAKNSTVRRSPRRTDVRQDDLAVSRWSERPGRTSVLDGRERGQSSVSRRKGQRPSRMSVSPQNLKRSEASTSRFDRSTERPSVRSRQSETHRSNSRYQGQSSPRLIGLRRADRITAEVILLLCQAGRQAHQGQAALAGLRLVDLHLEEKDK